MCLEVLEKFVVAKISFIVQLRRELNNDGKFHEVGIVGPASQ